MLRRTSVRVYSFYSYTYHTAVVVDISLLLCNWLFIVIELWIFSDEREISLISYFRFMHRKIVFFCRRQWSNETIWTFSNRFCHITQSHQRVCGSAMLHGLLNTWLMKIYCSTVFITYYHTIYCLVVVLLVHYHCY